MSTLTTKNDTVSLNRHYWIVLRNYSSIDVIQFDTASEMIETISEIVESYGSQAKKHPIIAQSHTDEYLEGW